jgi:uncharacterized protein YejL (UPF0352 family)
MKTLQQEYQLIKEGKGNKDHFLKVARHIFPEYITTGNNFDSAIHILKSKSLLSEGIGGIITQSPIQPDWFKIFNTKIAEAVGVKNTKEYGDQNEFEKPAPEVAKDLANQFDNNNPDNIDNVYGQSFLMGFYTEMQDEKNKDKSVYELKQIVLKNMVKNVNYYATEASFGVKGIGYTKDVVGGGDPVEPKGKYKSSGYGDMPKAVKEGLNEAKRPSIGDHIKEVEKSSQAIALEAKMNAIDEAIEKRKAKLALAESEELAEMIDQSMVKTLNKEIKELEKHKAKTQKIYEKMTGKAKEEEIIGEDKLNEDEKSSNPKAQYIINLYKEMGDQSPEKNIIDNNYIMTLGGMVSIENIEDIFSKDLMDIDKKKLKYWLEDVAPFEEQFN